MTNATRSVLIAACIIGMAAPVQAQVPGIDVKLNPRIGLYQPLSDLGEAPQAAGEAIAELEGSMALGLGLELDMALLPVGFRVNLDYATGTEVQYDNGIQTESGVETTVLAVVGDLMFRPFPRLVLAQPYLFAGGGLKQYDFEPTGADPIGDFEDTSDFTVHLGGGLEVGFGPLLLNAEVGDYISWWDVQNADGDTETQHDLFLTVGFAIGLL